MNEQFCQLRSTILGMITGVYCNITTGGLFFPIIVAFFTGAAAYSGQLFIKMLVNNYYKNKKQKK